MWCGGDASCCVPWEMSYCVSPFMLPYSARRAGPTRVAAQFGTRNLTSVSLVRKPVCLLFINVLVFADFIPSHALPCTPSCFKIFFFLCIVEIVKC